MASTRALLRSLFLYALLLVATIASAQRAPLCDVTCNPDPGSSTYGGTVASRPKLLNARGTPSPMVALATASFRGRGGAPTVVGSQSYNQTIPILDLAGRAGMDLNLSLYYNSRIWNVDPTGRALTVNADRDFPSYGFRLDFGYLEYDSANDQYIVTEGNGSKHVLPNSGTNYDSTDGTYMRYTVA